MISDPRRREVGVASLAYAVLPRSAAEWEKEVLAPEMEDATTRLLCSQDQCWSRVAGVEHSIERGIIGCPGKMEPRYLRVFSRVHEHTVRLGNEQRPT
jgi:hypothetical protein